MNKICKLSIKIEKEQSSEYVSIDLEDIVKKSQFRQYKIDKALKFLKNEFNTYSSAYEWRKALIGILEEDYLW